MTPRQPLPRWERDPCIEGSLMYRVDAGEHGVRGRIDRIESGGRRAFRLTVDREHAGESVSLREAKARVQTAVARAMAAGGART